MSKYKKYFFEFLVIFLSITLSFLLEDYRHFRIKKDNVTYALKGIEEGLVADIEQLEINIQAYDEYYRMGQIWLSDSVVTHHPDSMVNYYSSLFTFIDFSGNKTGFEIFIETEGKEIINNPSLRKQISKYFVHDIEYLEYQTHVDDTMVEERIGELLKSEVDFGPGSFKNAETFNKVKQLLSQGFFRNQLSMTFLMWKSNQKDSKALIEHAKELQSAIKKELEELG